MKKLEKILITLAIGLITMFTSTNVNAMNFEYTVLNLSSEQNYDNTAIARRVLFFNETEKNYTLESLKFENGIFYVSDSSKKPNEVLLAGKAINLEVTPVTTDLDVGMYSDIVTATFTDGTKISMPVNLEIIAPKTIYTIPTVSQLEFVYDGTEKSLDFKNLDLNNLNLIGETSATEAGDYWSLVGLKNSFTSKWEDGSTTSKWFRWEIKKRTETLAEKSLSANEGTKLSSVSLPENWSWDSPDTVIKLGNNTYYASYTPADEKNYNSVVSEKVIVKGIEVYTIDINTDSGISPLSSNSYVLDLGDNQTIKVSALTDKLISSIKVNGVEQLVDFTSTFTINVNSISEDINIEIASVDKTLFPIEGNSQEYIKNSEEKLVIKYDFDYNLFKLEKITIDGNEIFTGFEFSDGSLVLTFDSSLLSNLEVGKHDIEITLENGQSLLANFAIQEKVVNEEPETNTTINPETSDNIVVYSILTILSLAGLIILKTKYIKEL